MQADQFLTEFKEGNSNGMDTSLEWKMVVGQRRFTSGLCTVGEEEEDRNIILFSVSNFLRVYTKLSVTILFLFLHFKIFRQN